MRLDAFGKRYDLNLKKNAGLMADKFEIFYADPDPEGGTSFERAIEVSGGRSAKQT